MKVIVLMLSFLMVFAFSSVLMAQEGETKTESKDTEAPATIDNLDVGDTKEAEKGEKVEDDYHGGPSRVPGTEDRRRVLPEDHRRRHPAGLHRIGLLPHRGNQQEDDRSTEAPQRRPVQNLPDLRTRHPRLTHGSAHTPRLKSSAGCAA